jgi:nucleoid DNA-binding protein|tara:strand:+ start:81 stop:299 length:219 start_codon:yes stop_codon:yes gene_type:complete
VDSKTLIQKLASKYNLPLKTVENIVYHQFKFVSKIMSEGKFNAVRLPYFGKFHVNKNRLKHIKEKSGTINNK